MRTAVVPASDSDSQFDKIVKTQTERHIVVIFICSELKENI